jgi:Ca2+-binding RTX toxin-like protein
MTFKITQLAWFKWYDENGNSTFDDRALLFEASLDGVASSTFLKLTGTGYYLKVYGVNLAVDGNGILSGGTVNRIEFFDTASNIELVEFSGAVLDAAGFRDDYENDVIYPPNPSAAGYIFDARAVAAQANGDGIGTFYAGSGDDTMLGSGGADELVGQAGDDDIHGNGGNDLLWGEEGHDDMFGGEGNDDLRGYTGDDQLYGEGGNDFLQGWDGKDTLDGGLGNDDLRAGAGNDLLKGGKGHDFLVGDAGSDSLNGGDGRDWAAASLDDVTTSVTIDLAKKTIKSAYGTDKLVSIENAYGGDGRDVIKGSSGANALVGQDGKDTISGGSGNDTLWGGLGRDKLTGDAGKDTFFFWEYGGTYNDRVTDFKKGEDKIVLAQNPFLELALGKLKSSNFVLGTKAKDGNDHVIYDKKTGNLYYDEDGKGGVAKALIATLDSKPSLSAGDFRIVAATDFEDYWIV